MKPALLLAWRSLASKPGRTLTSSLGVAIGISTVLSVHVVDHNTILTQEQSRQAPTGLPDVELTPVKPGLTEDALAPVALSREPEIVDLVALFFQRVELKREGEDPVDLSLCGLSPGAAESFDAYEIERGADFTGVDTLEALLPSRLALELGVDVGDELSLMRLTRLQGCQDGRVVTRAIAPSETAPARFRIAGLLSPRNLGLRATVIVPFLSGAKLFEGGHLQPIYWGRLAEGAVYQDLQGRLKSSYVVEKPKLALVGERIDQRAFRKSIRVTSTLALLLGLFVIYNAFSMVLVERVREIGLLRALGFTRGEIATTVLLEGGLLATIGAALGIVLTAGLVFGMRALHITTLGYGKPLSLHEIPLGVALFVILLGMSFAVLGVTLPLLRTRKLKVIEALRAGRLAMTSDPGLALKIGAMIGIPVLLPLFYTLATPPLGERQELVLDAVLKIAVAIGLFFLLVLALPGIVHRLIEWTVVPLMRWARTEGTLARASIRGSQQRVLSTMTGLAVVVAAIFCVRAVNQSFLDEYADFSRRAMGRRVYVRTQTLPKAGLKGLEQVNGVARVYSASAEVLSPFPIRGVRIEDLAAHLPELRPGTSLGRDFERGETLILSRFLAESFDYRVGDEVRLATFSGPQSFRVGAVADEFGYFPDDRSFALMEMSRIDQLFCVNDGDGNRFIVDLEDGADPGRTIAGIRGLLPPDKTVWVKSDETLLRSYLLDRRRDFYVFDVMLGMTAFLAVAGMLNSLAIAVLERRREIGMLRTIGVTPRQVQRLLLLEALAVGLIGGLFAAGLSVPLSKFAVEGVSIISSLPMRHEIDSWSIVLPVASALLLSLLAAILPARHASRLHLPSLARHE